MDILEVVHIIRASFIFDLFWLINLTRIYKERTENELANNRYWPWQMELHQIFFLIPGSREIFNTIFIKLKVESIQRNKNYVAK